MRLTISAALAAASLLALSQPSIAARHATEGWHQPQQWRQSAPVRVAHEHRHHRSQVTKHVVSPEKGKLQAELTDLRRELDDLKQRLGAHPWDGVKVPFAQMEGDGGYKLASLPDLRQPLQEPAAPVIAPDVDPLAAARAFLKLTATPGYTMMRQGVDVAIGRLHPAFVMRLADGIRWAREHDLPHAGVYSAYRPPSFGVGGFRNKFNSMHSYGLAVDMTGIGSAGSRLAHLWQKAVQTVGLFLPYGPNNRAEFNHTQMLPAKVATAALRRTITASGPKDLRVMWMASGTKAYVPAEPPRDVAGK